MAESEMEVNLPELLDPRQLQELLQGQDYHMMETEIEALLFKAKADAKLKERKRIREITDQARDLPEMCPRYAEAKLKGRQRIRCDRRTSDLYL